MKDESRQVSVRASDGQSLTPVMTPREIVSELDRYIVGQRDAKRAVAVAVRTAGGASSCPRSCGTRSPPRTSS